MARAPKTKAAPAPTPAPVEAAAAAPADALAMPESFVAFATVRVKGGHVFLRLTLDKDLQVTNLEASEPNTWDLIQEAFKIGVGKHWMKEKGK